tara:strand:- start:633 stop:983 length:351 start_codon:yes stop_codon:yes gene_type:complete
MQRKKSNNRNGRLANASEKAFHAWLKEQPCCWCGSESGAIVDHAKGATFSHNKVHIGHRFCLCPCVTCDTEKTIHGKRLGNESEAWEKLDNQYRIQVGYSAGGSTEEWLAIKDWGK